MVELVHGRWLVSMRVVWTEQMRMALRAGNDETNVDNVASEAVSRFDEI